MAPGRWRPSAAIPRDDLREYLGTTVAQLDLAASEPAPDLLLFAHGLLDHLGPGGGLLVTGGFGHRARVNTSQAGEMLAETCATSYLVRALARTFELTGDLRCVDLIERIVNNALFAAQSPDGKQLRSFIRHEGGSGWNTAAVCCRMNYFRVISELPELVAYSRPDAIAVCQYVPGQFVLTFPVKRPPDWQYAYSFRPPQVSFQIETTYPGGDSARLRLLSPPGHQFALYLRIPGWCATPEVIVDGKAIPGVMPGRWAVVEREWKKDDVVVVHLPMSWRWVGGKGQQENKAALLRGPLVWRLDAKRSNLAGLVADQVVPEINSAPTSLPDTGSSLADRTVHLRARGAVSADLAFTPDSDPAGSQLWFRVPNQPSESW